MATKIDTVSSRDKLKPRREPYWHRVYKGCYLGYRKMAADSAGVWQARFSQEDGRKVTKSIGVLDDLPAHERFDKAINISREWFEHVGMGGATKAVTVLDACIDYASMVREKKGDKPADDLMARYRRWVEKDSIHKVELMKLTREHIKAFKRRLTAAPVKINKAGKMRERSKDSVNRDMATVRAALNYAKAEGKVTNDFAWSEGLKAYKNVSKRRELYLDRGQRRSFIEHAPDDLATFLRGLSMLPLRPGALAALKAGDFDARLSVLKIGQDKHGMDRKIKLPEATAVILKASAKNKLPTAPLFSRADGSAWNKDGWKWPIKKAATAATLPAGATAYTLRHSVISDLVHGGLDLLTVAQISGTSVAMIEKHYGHLRGEVAASALAKLAL
ncbi:tyrosine-type recombinase/integrase [Pseudoduganella sp. FT93W]|uniref:Tyrosine-type recombinase/integrase n=1 Tax=Duganella fentianensis TaxID=2692177 RepID=A0A845HY26_9BURK|nr:tyrosine-type recombinase/integrase [Duganella fentianensis]MYN45923.1 tyrosine-type recombinase/integrase [Duganella fentianensis]